MSCSGRRRSGKRNLGHGATGRPGPAQRHPRRKQPGRSAGQSERHDARPGPGPGPAGGTLGSFSCADVLAYCWKLLLEQVVAVMPVCTFLALLQVACVSAELEAARPAQHVVLLHPPRTCLVSPMRVRRCLRWVDGSTTPLKSYGGSRLSSLASPSSRPELLVCRGFGWNVCTACQCLHASVSCCSQPGTSCCSHDLPGTSGRKQGGGIPSRRNSPSTHTRCLPSSVRGCELPDVYASVYT